LIGGWFQGLLRLSCVSISLHAHCVRLAVGALQLASPVTQAPSLHLCRQYDSWAFIGAGGLASLRL
jgi:hypothetical protein